MPYLTPPMQTEVVANTAPNPLDHDLLDHAPLPHAPEKTPLLALRNRVVAAAELLRTSSTPEELADHLQNEVKVSQLKAAVYLVASWKEGIWGAKPAQHIADALSEHLQQVYVFLEGLNSDLFPGRSQSSNRVILLIKSLPSADGELNRGDWGRNDLRWSGWLDRFYRAEKIAEAAQEVAKEAERQKRAQVREAAAIELLKVELHARGQRIDDRSMEALAAAEMRAQDKMLSKFERLEERAERSQQSAEMKDDARDQQLVERRIARYLKSLDEKPTSDMTPVDKAVVKRARRERVRAERTEKKAQSAKVRKERPEEVPYDTVAALQKLSVNAPRLTQQFKQELQEKAVSDPEWAKEQLALIGMRILRHVAIRYHRKVRHVGVDIGDLISWGTAGVASAVKLFRFDGGANYVNYAQTRIHGAMIDGMRNELGAMKIPRSVLNSLKLGPSSGPEAENGVSPEADADDHDRPFVASLDGHAFGRSFFADLSPFEARPNPAAPRASELIAGAERAGRIESVAKGALECLAPEARFVMEKYYFEDLTLREIGELKGLTESRICQIKAKAEDKIKQWTIKHHPDFAEELKPAFEF